MTYSAVFPRVEVRETGTKQTKRHGRRLPTFGHHGKSQFSAELVSAVKFAAERDSVTTVARRFCVTKANVYAWREGVTHLHLPAAGWPHPVYPNGEHKGG